MWRACPLLNSSLSCNLLIIKLPFMHDLHELSIRCFLSNCKIQTIDSWLSNIFIVVGELYKLDHGLLHKINKCFQNRHF